ncbi:hypothetical protein JCM3765_005747 [Sporobolomyces pararoseus]
MPQGRVKGRRGALKAFKDLPLDLIFEICAHADVPALLALSNTNKSIRRVVLGESSSNLFKQARQRMGMPELLVPMTDLQYAELIFGKGCNFCSNKFAKVELLFRARICKTCLDSEDKFVTFNSVRGMRNLNRFVQFFADQTSSNGTDDDFKVHVGQLKHLTVKLDSLYPATALTRTMGNLYRDSICQYPGLSGLANPSEVSDETLAVLNSDWDYVTTAFWGILPASPVGEFQQAFLRLRQQRELRAEDAMALRNWQREMDKRKTQENQQMRLDRRNEIERRLEAAGFSKIEFENPEFGNHSLVKSTRPLSEKTWPTKIKPVLRKLLEDARQQRIRVGVEDYYDVFRDRDWNQAAYYPPISLYSQFESVVTLVRNASQCFHSPEPIPSEVQSAAQLELKSLVRNRFEQLVRALRMAYYDLEDELTRKGLEQIASEEEKQSIPQNFSSFTTINKVQLTLPPLPSWIPHDRTRQINDSVSNDEIRTFLETSPLARFECHDCGNLLRADEMTRHLSIRWGCQYGICDREAVDVIQMWTGDRQVGREEWMSVRGIEETFGSERALVKVDKDILSLSLKLQQVRESTTLVKAARAEGIQTSHHYELGLEHKCECPPEATSIERTVFLEQIYKHIRKAHSKDHSTVSIRRTVRRLVDPLRNWREERRLEK